MDAPETKAINMNWPVWLVEKLDRYAAYKGIPTRTMTVVFLLAEVLGGPGERDKWVEEKDGKG